MVVLFSIICLIYIDQIIKWYVCKLNPTNQNILGVFEITYVENTGGAFGVGGNNTLLITILNFLVISFIIHFIIKQIKKINYKTIFAVSMILAGGTSNLIDRIFRGFVVDYINISKYIKFPVFNFADILIIIGWILSIIFTTMYSLKTEEISEKSNNRNK